MAVESSKLTDGVKQAGAIRDLPEHRRSEAEGDAFAAVRAGLVASRNDEDALDSFKEQEMADVLEVLARVGVQKKVQRGRATECLRICLGRPRWFLAAKRADKLHEPLQSLLGDGLDLSGPPPEIKAVEAQPAPDLASLGHEAAAVVNLLVKGAAAMQRFGFEFPREKLDEPTEAFMLVYNGVNRLSTSKRMAACAAAVVDTLESSQIDMNGIARFLVGMYEHGARRAYNARVRYVADRLSELSAPFASALAALAEPRGGQLPWATSPTPSFEATPTDDSQDAIEWEAEPERWLSVDTLPPPDVRAVVPADGGGLQQQGRYAVHNGFKNELVVYVEQTNKEYRIQGGKTVVIDADHEQVDVRVNHVGFFGLTSRRTRLGREALGHMRYYSIVPTADGKACWCRAV